MTDKPNETPAPLSDADIAGIAERAAYVGSDVWEISEGINGRIGSIGPIEGYDGDALGLREGSRTADFVAHAPADIARLLATLAALERDNAALREIVAAVAGCPQGPDDFVILAISREMSNRARALLAGMQTPAAGATAEAGEDGEA